MRKRDVLTFGGVIVGAAGVLVAGLILKKFIANKKVEKFEEELVSAIIEKSPIKITTPKKKKQSKSRKESKLAKTKQGNALRLLKYFKPGVMYSQVELVDKSGIPYRTIRRYTEFLLQQKKIMASGYGKGKKFQKP